MATPESYLHLSFYRKYRGLTLESMGRNLGVYPSNAHYKELGRQGLTLPQLVTYVQTLCIPVDYLLEIPFTPLGEITELPRPPREHLIHIPCSYSKGG